MEKIDFENALRKHDWLWPYADGSNAHSEGRREEARLAAIAATSPEYQSLFDHYKKVNELPRYAQ